MTYSEQLKPWCIVRDIPNQENIVVKRFRRRDDAVAYLQVLKQSARDIAFKILFKAQNVNMPRENEALKPNTISLG
ncbi:hypothetical protein FD724_33580 (plasmid) [Nostoc sp. C057]|jgi:hypothetical protein|uniref:hypothetical protein n=2 Tax=unclassified Nostoc TaxID=2593658 RepID=UPI0015C3B032|nr:hypothetical protein [Nostoc sp. C057]QLE52888.1 hypothetical protein FD724_33580 [Nostoc sp. C057]